MLASYMAKKKHKEIKLYHILIVVAVIISLWALGWLIPAAKFGDSSGSFGDTFGGINALFSGLAFAGVIAAIYIAVTPAMALEMVGIGSQYAIAAVDADGNYPDGSKTYSITLPVGIPAKDFWSFVVYDPQTRSMLQTPRTAFPSLSSQSGKVQANADGSHTVYFGPKAPKGKESNWIQTVTGKGWFTILRLYGPLEPWFDKTWRPGEIELIVESSGR